MADELFPRSAALLAPPASSVPLCGIATILRLSPTVPIVVRSDRLDTLGELSGRRVRTTIVLLTVDARTACQAALLWGVVPRLLKLVDVGATVRSAASCSPACPAPPPSALDRIAWTQLDALGVRTAEALLVDDTANPAAARLLCRALPKL